MITKLFKQLSGASALGALALGIWSGAEAGKSFGLLVFCTYLMFAAILLLFSVLNNRIELKIAQLR